VTIRYLRRGESGAGVLLLIPGDPLAKLAKVVKYGRSKAICLEHENFTKSIKGKIPPEFAALTFDEYPHNVGDDWASFCYCWVGGNDNVEQVRHIIAHPGITPENLTKPVAELMQNVFNWYGLPLRQSAQSPANLWKWRAGSRRRIKKALKQATHPEIPKLLAFLDGDFPWNNAIGNTMYSIASRCHGDITCHNIVLSGSPSSLRPR